MKGMKWAVNDFAALYEPYTEYKHGNYGAFKVMALLYITGYQTEIVANQNSCKVVRVWEQRLTV